MESSAIGADAGLETVPRGRGFLADFFIRLFREKPLGAVGGIIFLMLLVTGIFANYLAPYNYVEMNPMDRLKPPSYEHLLGTDHLGRDMLSRIIYGARLSVIVGFAATAFSILISALLGITSGFFGGKYDLIVQRFVDAWMIFPGIVVLIVFVSIFSPGMWQIIIVLGLRWAITSSRIIRSAVIGVKGTQFMVSSSKKTAQVFLKSGQLTVEAIEGNFRRFVRKTEDDFDKSVEKEEKDFDDFIKKQEKDFDDFIDKQEKEFEEFVKHFEIKTGQSIIISGQDVRNIKTPEEVSKEFELLEDW